ncbi:hypothetical protein HRbin39_01916 [bacterium HR39]|nr:hypothetical protein HRbin39_01916 [bacterium HR39]
MRILFVGDVVGRSGRAALFHHLPEVRRRLGAHVTIVNGENAAGGFGLTPAIAAQIFEAGADVITTGNHVWDQRELLAHIEREPRILRPLNMVPGTPGHGLYEHVDAHGRRVVVAQVMGRLFMNAFLDDPFRAVDVALAPHLLGASVDAVVVDVHAEATSEKMAFGHFLDGRVSAVLGTHTHVPTADAMILPGGTAYMSDVGMTSDYDSVIGMVKGGAVQRFLVNVPGPRLEPSQGEATFCAVLVVTDDRTGRATDIRPIRLGGRLRPEFPEDLAVA